MIKNLAEALNNILQIINTKCVDEKGNVRVSLSDLDLFKKETRYLKKRMSLQPIQSLLFAAIVQCHGAGGCTVADVGKMLGLSFLEILALSRNLLQLQDLHLVCLNKDKTITVPDEVIDALMADNPAPFASAKDLSEKEIYNRISSLLDNLREGRHYIQTVEDVDRLAQANPDSRFGRTCARHAELFQLSSRDRLMFYIIVYLCHEDGMHTCIDSNVCMRYYEHYGWMEEYCEEFDKGTPELLTAGLIDRYEGEPSPVEELFGIDYQKYVLSAEICKELFPNASSNSESSAANSVALTDCANKPAKALFYNPAEQKQVERLRDMLGEEALQKVFENLKARGLRTGITCLFHGAPGTGKTETVYQLARLTGRKLLEADAAQLRGQYYGDSEKSVRELFKNYRKACQENDRMPILLFNEADAVLGKRMDGAVRAIDRTENSLQNLLLEEMENFSGIFIATTNLDKNLDPAFDRRFLYKICFSRPEAASRKQIWVSQFDGLQEEVAAELAAEFDLSGGQIENVARKYTIDNVMYDKPLDLEQLRQFCREEARVKEKTVRQKIGF